MNQITNDKTTSSLLVLSRKTNGSLRSLKYPGSTLFDSLFFKEPEGVVLYKLN
jgi:hypothetical protein